MGEILRTFLIRCLNYPKLPDTTEIPPRKQSGIAKIRYNEVQYNEGRLDFLLEVYIDPVRYPAVNRPLSASLVSALLPTAHPSFSRSPHKDCGLRPLFLVNERRQAGPFHRSLQPRIKSMVGAKHSFQGGFGATGIQVRCFQVSSVPRLGRQSLFAHLAGTGKCQ